MKPTAKNKIDEFIDSYIKKCLFEDLESDNITNVLKYFDDEEKKARTLINTNNRLKGMQINADQRAIKEKEIKVNKDRLTKIQDMKKNFEAEQTAKAKVAQTQTTGQNTSGNITGQITGQINTGVAENVAMPIITRGFAEQAPAPMQAPLTQAMTPAKKKTTRVMFDKSTGKPFYVDFSERGFSINGTRLSFELIESALSKEFNIVLEQGNGQMLDQVKMQKILKYKDRF